MSGCAAQYSRTRGNRARLPVERGFERSATLAMSLHIFHRDGDRSRRIPDRKGRLLVARLAEVEDVDAGIVRHAAAIAREVGLAVAVDVVAHRDAIDARFGQRDADGHRPGARRHFGAGEPAALLQPVGRGAAIALYANLAGR